MKSFFTRSRYLILLAIIVFICFNSSLLRGKDDKDSSDENPFLQLVDVITSIDDFDKTKSPEEFISFFDESISRIDRIKPTECSVGDISFSEEEMEFLLLFFKIDFSVTFQHGKKTVVYLKQLEELLDSSTIDLDSVSEKYRKVTDDPINICFAFLYDRVEAYSITGLADPDTLIPFILDVLEAASEPGEVFRAKLLFGDTLKRSGRFRLAIKEFEECLDYFDETQNAEDSFFALNCVSLLRICYLCIEDFEAAEVYRDILEEACDNLNINMLRSEICLSDLLYYLISGNFQEKDKENLEKIRKHIIEQSNSDLQILSFYLLAAGIEMDHLDMFSPEVVLSDLEKYYSYKRLIWENEDIFGLQEVEDILKDARNEMLSLLADREDIEKLNYWATKFERMDYSDTAVGLALSSFEDKDIISAISSYFSRYEEANQILVNEGAKKAADQDKVLLQKAHLIKRELEQEFEKLNSILSENDSSILKRVLADRFVISPDCMEQLSSILPADTACVQYLLLDDRIVTYLTLHNAPPFVFSNRLSKGQETIGSFKRRLVRIRTLLQDPDQVDMINKEMQYLYDNLFADIRKKLDQLGIRRIVVNASGLLRYIPFAALFDGDKYLVENYQITTITGMDMVRLAKKVNPATMENISISVFADPDGSLPSARKEGELIAGMFTKKDVFVGQKASINEFQSLAGDINFVHLATHAFLDSRNPANSYVLFANGEKLYYSDMMGFNMKDVDVITLSACSTAMTEKSTGGEIEGMAYQLLRKSPSGSILASLWQVDDTATTTLMCQYYKHMIESIRKDHTLDRGGALRDAQLALLHNQKTSAPFYWAAFTLFGDFR